MIVKHKFINFENSKDIEILILGTFNPDTSNNEAEFFYGRTRNFLWNLLPKVYGYNGLKYSSTEEKLDFIKQNKIGFIDLIAEIQVEDGQEKNYSDSFIDSKVIRWNNIINLIDKSKYLKNIYLTRKTFTDIPEMKKQIDMISDYCLAKNINFIMLPTPARFENTDKLNEWKKDFNK